MGSAENINKVKAIVESDSSSKIIVVSAVGGITDKLINTAKTAVSGDKSYVSLSTEIKEIHLNIIRELFLGGIQKEVEQKILSLTEELDNLYKGVYLIKELSKRTLDLI